MALHKVEPKRRRISRVNRRLLHSIIYATSDPKLTHEVRMEITGAALDAVSDVIGVYVGNLEREYRRIKLMLSTPIEVELEEGDPTP